MIPTTIRQVFSKAATAPAHLTKGDIQSLSDFDPTLLGLLFRLPQLGDHSRGSISSLAMGQLHSIPESSRIESFSAIWQYLFQQPLASAIQFWKGALQANPDWATFTMLKVWWNHYPNPVRVEKLDEFHRHLLAELLDHPPEERIAYAPLGYRKKMSLRTEPTLPKWQQQIFWVEYGPLPDKIGEDLLNCFRTRVSGLFRFQVHQAHVETSERIRRLQARCACAQNCLWLGWKPDEKILQVRIPQQGKSIELPFLSQGEVPDWWLMIRTTVEPQNAYDLISEQFRG
ncbi:hypothetical protein [Pontibacter sp. G13]|uniref:hypothetical protein n=1 Tax=Pontibacter sp. G13 TaxID=3074898 RepID=UPI00288AD69B|nr:hypothetical protein [Pontibacter sp. G13]WNJ17941.1 hypothetical protein RJD25_24060 [Pontibacter sp. G13]